MIILQPQQIIGGSGSGATVETIDCIRFTYHQQNNKIIIPCSTDAVDAMQAGTLSGALIPTWRSSNVTSLSSAANGQVIWGFTIYQSSVSQIFITAAMRTVALSTMQNMRTYFTFGSNDYSGQGSTGTNISITYSNYDYIFLDSIVNNASLRWQAILAY